MAAALDTQTTSPPDAFLEEVRAWLEANAPNSLVGKENASTRF